MENIFPENLRVNTVVIYIWKVFYTTKFEMRENKFHEFESDEFKRHVISC